jgi:hypothetical protein
MAKKRTGNLKEDRIRDEADALMAEIEKLISADDIRSLRAHQVAYEICKQSAACKHKRAKPTK